MKLIWDVRDSIYGPEYYKELLQKPFSYSLKYFFFLALTLAFTGSLLSFFTVLPGLQSFLRDLGPKILEHYPQNLTVTVKDGVVSTNVQEPYFVKIPQEYADGAKKSGVDEGNLFVIDTKHDATPELFTSYKTIVLLSSHSVMFKEENGKITIQQLDKVRDFKLDKDVVSSWLDKIEPYFKYAGPLFAIGIFFLFFFAIAFNLFYLFGFALLIWAIAAMKKIKIGYKKSYQLGLHLITAGILLSAIFALAAPGVQFPYLALIIAIIGAAVNLKRPQDTFLDVKPPVEAPPATP